MKKKGDPINCFTCSSRLKSIFCDIKENDLYLVNKFKSRLTYPKGSTLFYRDTHPSGLFVIERGLVKIHLPAGKGHEQIIRIAAGGDILGYRALLTKSVHNTTAEAIDETEVCFLSNELFESIYENNKSVHMQIIQLMAEGLKVTQQKLSSSSFKQVRARVAETLLSLREKFGVEEETKTINIVLSRQDLSSIAGMAKETLIRNLIQLKEEEVIGFIGKKIKLLDTGKLQLIAYGNS